MDLIVSQQRNEVIWALQRCGTNHLRAIAASGISDWRLLFGYKNTDKLANMKVTRIVRDPLQRWLSWFTSFVVEVDDPDTEHPLENYGCNVNVKQWDLADARQFITQFEKIMYDDYHTIPQHIGYFEYENLNHNNHFVLMENIDIYLQISQKQHQPAFKEVFYNLESSVQQYIMNTVCHLYEKDYLWMNELDLSLVLPTQKTSSTANLFLTTL